MVTLGCSWGETVVPTTAFLVPPCRPHVLGLFACLAGDGHPQDTPCYGSHGPLQPPRGSGAAFPTQTLSQWVSERLLIPVPRETHMGLKFKQGLEMGILLSFQQGYQDKCDHLKAAFGLGGSPLHSPPPPALCWVSLGSGYPQGWCGAGRAALSGSSGLELVGAGGSSGSGCGAEPAPRCIPPPTAAGLWFLGTSPEQDLAPPGQPPHLSR